MTLRDRFGRTITDLRVSVTDRCNFRCIYCRASEPETYESHDALLRWDELLRLCSIFSELGIRKVRVTGGEPLVRPGIEDFLRDLSRIELIEDISMTTNGLTLDRQARMLREAGVGRINISVDSLRPERFDRITRTPGALDRVLAGIDAAIAAGLSPVKVNAVLIRGFNDDEIVEFAEFARERELIMRFIEFMPLDADHIWDRDRVVTAGEIRSVMEAAGLSLRSLPRQYASETALRYAFAGGGKAEIGIVAPVSQPFCGDCSRLRLTADGKIRTCLFSQKDHDLRDLLRSGADDASIMERIFGIVEEKEAGHRINEPDFAPANRTMVFIGG